VTFIATILAVITAYYTQNNIVKLTIETASTKGDCIIPLTYMEDFDCVFQPYLKRIVAMNLNSTPTTPITCDLSNCAWSQQYTLARLRSWMYQIDVQVNYLIIKDWFGNLNEAIYVIPKYSSFSTTYLKCQATNCVTGDTCNDLFQMCSYSFIIPYNGCNTLPTTVCYENSWNGLQKVMNSFTVFGVVFTINKYRLNLHKAFCYGYHNVSNYFKGFKQRSNVDTTIMLGTLEVNE
jgi:hypothetical protein